MTAETRILILAVRGRDAEVVDQVLRREGLACRICVGVDQLVREIGEGAGAVVLTEESRLKGGDTLSTWLHHQPAWSDFPFILLSTKRVGRRPLDAQRILEELGNVVLLERPIHGETLVSAVNSALRGRLRQYETRRHLADLTAAEERLTDSNARLEQGIARRTAELSSANNRLTEEVAERERAQAALAQAQKMEAVGQLTGGIAHDFNNLLTAIFGNLELIQRRTEEPRTAKLAGFAQEAAERAAKLTHQLLAFSRSQRLDLRPVSLNGLVLGMNDLLARTLGQSVSIRMALDEGEPWALADTNQLELAILNLAINARDAMGGAGDLVLSTGLADGDGDLSSGRYGVVRVVDSGPGVPPGLLTKVFDPFFTTKPVGKGTGLGLSQVFGIARQSGGTARLANRADGQGAVVEIWLPEAAPASRAAEARPQGPAPDGAQRRILVIDDDDGVRRFIVEGLESLGYEVDGAASGEEGLARLDASRPDLVVVDYAMPVMTGVQVVESARAIHPDLPIIIATGFADMEAVESAVSLECVLRKPFRLDDLGSAVRATLETSVPRDGQGGPPGALS